MRKSLVVLSVVLLIYGVWAQSSHGGRRAAPSVHFAPAAVAAFQKIDAERIRAHVAFLSHDLLEGRGTGQRGGDIAARVHCHAIRALRTEAGRRQRHLHAEGSHGRRHTELRKRHSLSCRPTALRGN